MKYTVLNLIFWLTAASFIYAYFGYPLCMKVLLKVRKPKEVKKGAFTPFISLVIAAYNEEKNIGAKLNEVLYTDYPKDKMEIIVVSDCSSDRTDEIVKSFADKGVRLFRLEQRTGKIGGYRKVFPILKGEIIVFSDATSLLNPESIPRLIDNFNDPKVGCVGGLLAYMNPKGAAIGRGERKYWTYEKRIRELESALSSLTSVSGTLYAVRKELYPLNMKDYLADDLIVPISVVRAGYRVVLEKDASCKEFTTLTTDEEVTKRVRITVQNIRGITDQFGILNPFKYGLYSFMILSHKVGRLMVPVFLIILFFINLFLALHSIFFAILLICQLLFYLGAWKGYQTNKTRKSSLGNYLSYFCLSNLAILIGIFRFFAGEKVTTWETMRAEY